jgi:hypothetical protein
MGREHETLHSLGRVGLAGCRAAVGADGREADGRTENINAIDYKQQYEKEREKNQQLPSENASLQSQLAEWTRKGGSLVHAYCETPTMSANSAGARNDCSVSGYTCEPVSGVCRTSARSSDECATGYLLDVDHCVPRPR